MANKKTGLTGSKLTGPALVRQALRGPNAALVRDELDKERERKRKRQEREQKQWAHLRENDPQEYKRRMAIKNQTQKRYSKGRAVQSEDNSYRAADGGAPPARTKPSDVWRAVAKGGADTLTINQETIDTRVDYVDLDILRFWNENPRLQHHLDSMGHDPARISQKDLYRIVFDHEGCDALVDALIQTGETKDKIIVTHDGVVVEGNRRLAAYRYIYYVLGKEDFGMIPCVVLHRNITESQIAELLLIEHVKTKKPWEAMAQARHMWRMHMVDRLPMTHIAKVQGTTTARVKKFIVGYTLMRAYQQTSGDLDHTKWTIFSKMDKLERRFKAGETVADGRGTLLQDWIFRMVRDRKLVDCRHVDTLCTASDLSILTNERIVRMVETKGSKAAVGYVDLKRQESGDAMFNACAAIIDLLEDISVTAMQKTAAGRDCIQMMKDTAGALVAVANGKHAEKRRGDKKQRKSHGRGKASTKLKKKRRDLDADDDGMLSVAS